MTWRDDAACHPDRIPEGMSPDDFFPFDITHPVEMRAAKERALNLCSACPVRHPCLGDAMEIDAVVGVWGGRYMLRSEHRTGALRALRLGRV